MKRFLLNLLYVCAMSISLVGYAGSASAIDQVKDGILEMNKSTTVGEAFDNYDFFTKTTWTKWKTKQGVTIVEFNGKMDLTEAFTNYELFKKFMTMSKADLKRSPEAMTAALEFMTMIQKAQETLDNLEIPKAEAIAMFGNMMTPEFEKQVLEKIKNDIIYKTAATFVVQFTINRDETFKISYIGVTLDGRDYGYPVLDEISRIYNNDRMDILSSLVFLKLYM